ncbi:cell-envelope stress modulator CpxP [Entomohabitans teleogrylli]|uniref:cell-envelope stress modulator CpxP n=1 Tax=Entomohabitans teleogrylli TaxID=1384589 RepID=UPI00073DA33F|nr:cell-envelope stress modulator CpxP [Entomohabitans teleogrylli]
MRNVTAAIVASTLAFGAIASQAADSMTGVNWHQTDGAVQQGTAQSHMFDGISLTEQQRQQMRDLMQRARHDSPSVNVSELEHMHRLIIADKFDETAIRAQAEKIAQEQVARQVEMARVRNQMYRLLTPEQQAVLKDRHQQRMNELRELADVQRGSSLQLISSSGNR